MTARYFLRAALAFLAAAPAAAKEAYHWVQYTASGLEARAIVDGGACPAATIDGAPATMTVRSDPAEAYPITVCALPLPKGAAAATVSGMPLPLPKPRADRILLIGDTGCRVLGDKGQACNDMSQWPFRLGADVSATLKPDLVLHVGDFHYRESECPLANKGCAGTPFGDTWDVWREDFFIPGDSLLKAAPWIMVRGNHEECERGGIGWVRALDPYPFESAAGRSGCLGPARPYTVDIGGVTVQVMDVSTAGEKANDAQTAWYRGQFAAARDIAGPVWLAFHRPVWAMDAVRNGVAASGQNRTLEAAALGAVSDNVQAFVSGHIHTFMAMSYVEDLPLQIVSGHGGDDLVPTAPDKVVGVRIDNVTVKAGVGKPMVFGFSLLERDLADPSGMKWKLTGFDTKGNAFAVCRMDGRAIDCD